MAKKAKPVPGPPKDRKAVEMLAVDTLIPYARNAKKHSDEQVRQVAGSIKEFGFNNPILIDELNGIIAGHCRVLAAEKLGLEEVPCLRLTHLSETQKRAYILADNRLAETGGGWNAELLKLELEDLADEFDIDSLLGFSKEALDGIYGDQAGTGGKADDQYTRKIEVPIYEPKGHEPDESELFDRTKTDELLREIKAAKLPKEVDEFLRLAAERHTVFRFDRIAEYYCHADPKVQDLMERSALVIIDFDKAVECGFVDLARGMMDQVRESIQAGVDE